MQIGKAPIGLRYFAPHLSLRNVVSSYYLFHVDLPYCADSMRADLPQLRFMVKGKAWYHLANGVIADAPDVNLLGPTFGPTPFEGRGPMVVFGVGLMPAGWAALIREDASLYAGSVVDGVHIIDASLAQSLEAMRQQTSGRAMADIVDQTLRDLFARAQEPPLWFTKMTGQWLADNLSPEVDDLVALSGMSGRQVERLTNRIYGAPPKLLARKYRALKAASRLIESGASWQEVAGDAFFDQSHFIREFKQFVGATPRQLLLNPSPLTRLTFQRRKLVDTLPELTLIT